MPRKPRPAVHVRFRVYEDTPELYQLFTNCAKKHELALRLLQIGQTWMDVDSTPIRLIENLVNLINESHKKNSSDYSQRAKFEQVNIPERGPSTSLESQNRLMRAFSSSLDDLLGGPP